MATSKHRELKAIATGGLLMATVQACTSYVSPSPVTRGSVYEVGVASAPQPHKRVAEGSGFVTVDVTVFQAALPNPAAPPARTTLIARFVNQGDENRPGNKKEKRYKWKPATDRGAYYDLVLVDDGTPGRTKWIMWEYRTGHNRAEHGTGYLAVCDPEDHYPGGVLAVSFKDCKQAVPYNPGETAGAIPGGTARFASHVMSDGAAFGPYDAPAWISCTSGCCSLGAQQLAQQASNTRHENGVTFLSRRR